MQEDAVAAILDIAVEQNAAECAAITDPMEAHRTSLLFAFMLFRFTAKATNDVAQAEAAEKRFLDRVAEMEREGAVMQ